MEPLLAAIVLWLSANYGLPADMRHPRIEFVPSDQLADLRLHPARPAHAAPEGGRDTAVQPTQHDIEGIYLDTAMTIYLPLGWNERSLKDVSVLVHEMVHHLQSFTTERYDCPQQREKLAYKAQEKWLQEHGKSLEGEFGLDPFSVFAKSLCN